MKMSQFATILFLVSGLLITSPSFTFSAGETTVPVLEPFPLPRSLSLCGEPMPLDNPDVREMLDREFQVSVWDRARVFLWFKRAARYFPYIEKRLAETGMPDDLKYLSVAESSLLTHVRSNAGALGPWQFMAATAERIGLRIDKMMDERMDFERSTEAAFNYLMQLKQMFGSWTAAMAAYNCGENRLKSEMNEQRVAEYYRLDLPFETERYIFRIAAIKIIMENPRRYGYSVPKEHLYMPVQCDAVPVSIQATIHIADVAQGLGTDFKVIKELNPQILGRHLSTGNYTLRVPPGTGSRLPNVLRNLTPSPAPSNPQPATHLSEGHYTVKPGDTLSEISRKTGVSVDTLKKLNSIEGSVISPGQKLRTAP